MKPQKAKYTGQDMDYSDVYITADAVLSGPGSTFVSLDTLIDEGLYKLFPEFMVINKTTNPGLETPVGRLRKFWFRSTKDLTTRQISLALAAKLAGQFQPVRSGNTSSLVPGHLFAWFLTLKNQDWRGTRFMNWLARFTKPRPDGRAYNEILLYSRRILEIRQYAALNAQISKRYMTTTKIQKLDSSIPRDQVSMQAKKYRRFRKKRNLRKKRALEDAVKQKNLKFNAIIGTYHGLQFERTTE